MDPISSFISQHVREGDVALDIGANQGLYTRELVAMGARVFAAEPNPRILPILQVQAPGATFIEAAVSDRTGTAEFFVDLREGLGGAASSLNQLDGMEEVTERVTVPLTTIDMICAEREISPSFIKVDVEGHEKAVFNGARETIARCRPAMIFEFWETWWTNGVSDIFDQLAPDYDLVILQTGENAKDVYPFEARDGVVDIGCIPLRS